MGIGGHFLAEGRAARSETCGDESECGAGERLVGGAVLASGLVLTIAGTIALGVLGHRLRRERARIRVSAALVGITVRF